MLRNPRKQAMNDPGQGRLFGGPDALGRPAAPSPLLDPRGRLRPNGKKELERLQSQLKRTTQLHFGLLRSAMRHNHRLNAMNREWNKFADEFRLERKWPTVDQFQKLGRLIESEEMPLAAFYHRSLLLLGRLDAALSHQNLGFYQMQMSQWAVKPTGSAEQYIGNYILLQNRR